MAHAADEHRYLKRRAMGGGMLAFTLFCCVSGGPFGLEPLVAEVGPSLALALIAAMPLLWALPDSLTTCELAPAIPVEGGYIVWVRRALGPVFGFLNGWWTWVYALLDSAIYPVLFAVNLGAVLELHFGFDALSRSDPARWLVSVAMIVGFAYLNARGTRLVGLSSALFAGLIVLPFALLVGVGAGLLIADPRPILPESTAERDLQASLGAGLAIAMWNYLGWDQLSTIAEEVDHPHRAYPKAIMIGLPLVAAVYFFPVLIGLAFYPEPSKWQEGAWPAIADAIGGPWLSVPVTVASLVSPVALFTASVLATTRVPFALAEDGMLPRWFVSIHHRWGTPVRAIAFHAAVYAVLAFRNFAELVELNVLMYCAALSLESASLIVLRVKEPNLKRPFKVPGGYPVLALVFALPVSVAVAMVAYSIRQEGWGAQWPSLIALASGPVALGITLGVKRLALRRRER